MGSWDALWREFGEVVEIRLRSCARFEQVGGPRELGFRPWFPNSRGLARRLGLLAGWLAPGLGLLAGADLGPGPGPEESMKVRKYESGTWNVRKWKEETTKVEWEEFGAGKVE